MKETNDWNANNYNKHADFVSLLRDTKIDDISNWLDIFANGVMAHLSDEQKINFNKEVRDVLKLILYTEKEGWVVDYVRLRLEAIKLS